MLKLMSLVAHYLAALAIPDLGLVRLRRLIDAFGGIEAAAAAPRATLELVEGVPPRVARSFGRDVANRLANAEAQLRGAHAAGLTVTCWEDAAHPQSLRDDPAGCAPVLFIQGRLPASLLGPAYESLGCAVVGTRRATGFSLGFARDLGRALARAGVVVVSGLALGVDGAAHEGALEGGASVATTSPGAASASVPRAAVGVTVAVLGGGHDRLHPASHQRLAEQIVAAGGAVLSEWPLGISPRRHSFLRRNRVISGLSRVVAVIEAGEKSGALNTVGHALEQGRPIAIVPSRPGDNRFAGNLALLRDGAQPLIDVSDLLSHFGELTSPVVSREANGATRLLGSQEGRAAQLTSLLAGSVELSLDVIQPRLGLPTGELLALLTELQLLGVVSVTTSGRYRLRGKVN